MPKQRRLSLRQRVVVAIVVAVALGVGGYGALAYREVSRSILATTEGRLRGIAQQLTQASAANNATRDQRYATVAADPAVRAVIRSATPANVAAARKVLATLGADNAALVVADIRDATGRVVLKLRDSQPTFSHPTAGTDTVNATPLFARGDTVLIEYGAPIRDAGAIIGRVARVQSTAGSAGNLQTVLRLIGNGAKILLGNADGSLWTDLEHRVQRPPPTNKGLVTYERDGARRVSVSSPYLGTAIVAAVEMPEDLVLAPQRAVLWILVGAGALVVLLAAAVGWWASSGITRPIVRLTDAAERISAGDLASPIGDALSMPPVDRLAASFEAMRRSVKSAHDSLETQVADRTRELHEAQEELVRKERLATLGQLSSSVGHELRNPLGVMTNAVYFLEMTLKDVPQKVRDYLGILRTQVRLSEKIVSDLRDFARGKEPQRTAVALRQVVDEQLGRVTIPPTVRVDRDVPDSLPTVQVDAVQVGQVVLNLITNAAQAMEADGGVLTLRAAASNGTVRLSVEDTGPGIAPENLAKVFEPLFTTKARGIGLGLSVSRSLAVANGGMLAVTSEPGHGAHFTLDLPTRAGA